MRRPLDTQSASIKCLTDSSEDLAPSECLLAHNRTGVESLNELLEYCHLMSPVLFQDLQM